MTPNIFIRIGDTDCWDVTDKARDMSADSTLRVAHNNSTAAPNYKRIGGRKRWAIADIPVGGLHLEGVYLGGTTARAFFGIALATDNMENGSTSGPSTDVSYRANGEIFNDNGGTAAQTGLTVLSPGDIVGVDVIPNGDDLDVTFTVNDVQQGTAETFVAGGVDVRAVCNCGDNTITWVLCADADDQRFLPSGRQPWGAAARVSDIGGYSPAGSIIDEAYTANAVLYDDLRTMGNYSGGNKSESGKTSIASRGDALLYVEFLIEDDGTNGSFCGLGNAAQLVTQYCGQSSNSAGIRTSNGGIYKPTFSTSPNLGSYSPFPAGSRVGVIYDPVSGGIWWTYNGILGAGDPETGTGAHHTLAGPVFPMFTPYADSTRVRVCTHAWEQAYRPSYATAWDGTDILPEQHHRARIASDTEITQELWFQPWGGSRKSGSPIGAIELHNQDGRYDPLRAWDLRDQQIAIYERIEDGTIEPLARALVDNVKRDGRRKIRIMSRGVDAVLDTRIESEVSSWGDKSDALLLGSVAYADARLSREINPAELFYNVGWYDGLANQYNWIGAGAVIDMGVSVTTYDNMTSGFTRTVSPAGKQAVKNASVIDPNTGDLLTLSNSDFSAWTGDTPNSWTETSGGSATSNVTPGTGGTGAHFIRDPGALIAKVSQSVTSPEWVEIFVSEYVSGDLSLFEENPFIGRSFGITGRGVYRARGSGEGSVTLVAQSGTDLTIAWVKAYTVPLLDTFEDIVDLLCDAVPVDYSGLSLGTYNQFGTQSFDKKTRNQYLDELGRSALVDRYTDAEARLVFVQWPIRVGVANEFGDHTPTATFDDRLRVGELVIDDDLAPALSDGHGYNRNYAVHSDTDIAGSVEVGERTELTTPHRVHRYSAATLALSLSYAPKAYHSFYAHAMGAAPTVTLRYGIASDGFSATSEATDWFLYSLHRTYAERRRFFTDRQPVVTHRSVKPGDMVSVTSSDINGLPSDPVMVVKKARRLLSPTIEFKLWG